tara:strand:- start:1089 stop:1508 length:420 start_codon:yes stop_codon:yes gene_type:complete
LIGLVTFGLEDPFRVQFLHHLISAIQKIGYRLLVIDVSDPAHMSRSMLNLVQYQVAGVVVTSGSLSPKIGQNFIRCNVLVVLINRAVIAAPRQFYEQPASAFIADFIGDANLVQGAARAINGEQAEATLTWRCAQMPCA